MTGIGTDKLHEYSLDTLHGFVDTPCPHTSSSETLEIGHISGVQGIGDASLSYSHLVVHDR